MAGRAVRGVLGALALGALLGAGAYIALGSNGGARPGRPPGDAVVASANLERSTDRSDVERAVLRVDVESCGKVRQGTATMIRAQQGAIGLTNAHVVRGADSVRLSGAGLGVADAAVQGHPAGDDLATVDVSVLEPPSDAPLRPGGTVRVGDVVTTAGFPDGRWQVRSGVVVEVGRRRVSGAPSEAIVVDVPARAGTSGGVVLDRDGHAVGLIAESEPRTGYTVAYPIDEVLASERDRSADGSLGCSG